jgi:DNA-binding MarR family transcriptional regulator
MNAIAFGNKRAFHSFLRVTRKGFASVGLTAARFDLMNAILGNPRAPSGCGILQRELRRVLGVSAGVISRMLRSLEDLGLITREPPPSDRRQRHVKLTASGGLRLASAHSLLVRAVRRLVYEAICLGRHRDPEQRWMRMAELEAT